MSKTNIIKKDLIEKIYDEVGFSKIICENLVNDILKLLISYFNLHHYNLKNLKSHEIIESLRK